MLIHFDTSSADDYRLFIKAKRLPRYRFVGSTMDIPDEYASKIGLVEPPDTDSNYEPSEFLFDYQSAIAEMAVHKRKFAVFADCGLGKTLILLEYARHVAKIEDGPVLIVSPLMVIRQTIDEVSRWYGDDLVEQVAARDLPARLKEAKSGVLITNYEALTEYVEPGNIVGLVLDESSMLKSHYGKWARHCLRIGSGLRWKLALTGTPAPNDRIEYANHAVFVDAHPTVNSFLARYFVNKGQTSERWVMKPHAVESFYRELTDWSIFVSNPSVYGWEDGVHQVPPICVHVHDVALTDEQTEIAFEKTGQLFANNVGGITSRSVLSQVAKGSYRGARIASNKPGFIAELVKTWPDESTIVWARFNEEQKILEEAIPDSLSITGSTSMDERQRIIDKFKSERGHVLISKPKILGFGLNLQVATRQVFSGLQDSYEEYYQAVKRSNRIGSTKSLQVHIPVTDIERPMVENVLAKARMVEKDTKEQEAYFRKVIEC